MIFDSLIRMLEDDCRIRRNQANPEIIVGIPVLQFQPKPGPSYSGAIVGTTAAWCNPQWLLAVVGIAA